MSSSMKLSLIIMFASSLLQTTLGEIMCENLPNNVCAFSIASSGKRCVLENYEKGDFEEAFMCKTSEVVVEKMADYIERDECINACGVNRISFIGLSSDTLVEPRSMSKVCSPECYQHCPNIVDLYFNLAAGEGVFLPDLCAKQRSNPHRGMIELLSSGIASGPVPYEYAVTPVAAAPAYF